MAGWYRHHPPIRPPFSITEQAFRSRCDRCDACRTSCPTGIIGRCSDGYPTLLFGQADCTFCGACAEACPTDAIDLVAAPEWNVIAHIKGKCLSFNGITCRACDEACELGSIRFKLMTAGRSLPLVDEAGCTGCGACARVCPNSSIEMRRHGAEESVS